MEAQSQTFELPYEQLPLRVANLKVEGISHTSPDIPLGLKETFNRVHSFQDLNAAFFTLERYLLSTKLYKDVKFAVMPPAIEKPGDVDVHMVLTEYNSFSATIGMDQPVGAPLPVATGSVKFSNLIRGFGEYAQATLSRDPSGALSAVELAVRDVYPTLDHPFKYHAQFQHSVSSREALCGLSQQVTALTLGGERFDGKHAFDYTLAYRNAIPIGHHPESAVISHTYQPNLKSAFRYSTADDHRNDPLCPTSGELGRASAELSPGLFGDHAAFKLEGSYQQHHPIQDPRFPNAAVHMTVRAGVQSNVKTAFNALLGHTAGGKNPDGSDVDLDEVYPDVPVFDRFYAQPNFTRGYNAEDMGPKSGRFAFGADMYATATVSASTAIPDYESLPIRPHVFANVTDMRSLSTLLKNSRGGKNRGITDPTHVTASLGCGIVFPTQWGRIEVNVASKVKGFGLTKPRVNYSLAMDW